MLEQSLVLYYASLQTPLDGIWCTRFPLWHLLLSSYYMTTQHSISEKNIIANHCPIVYILIRWTITEKRNDTVIFTPQFSLPTLTFKKTMKFSFLLCYFTTTPFPLILFLSLITFCCTILTFPWFNFFLYLLYVIMHYSCVVN